MSEPTRNEPLGGQDVTVGQDTTADEPMDMASRFPESPGPTEPCPEPSEEAAMGPWAWLRRTARLWGFLAFVLVILAAFRHVIIPFVIATLVAYILAPLLRYLGRLHVRGRRPPRFVLIMSVYALLLGLIGLFFTSFVPRLSRDIKRIVHELPEFRQKARDQWVPAIGVWIEDNLGTDANGSDGGKGTLPDDKGSRLVLRPEKGGEIAVDISQLHLQIERVDDDVWVIRPPGQERAGQADSDRYSDAINNYVAEVFTRSEKGLNQLISLGQSFLVGIFKTITTFILVLMVSAFLLADTGRMIGWLRNLVPRIYYDDFDKVIVLIDKGLSGAIRGQFIICIINGVLTWLGLHLIGIKYAMLLGLLAGTMSLIPIFGSIISSIPIVVVALVSGEHGVDVLSAFLILLWIIGIHLLEANLLNPKIMGTAAKIHPVLVIFAVVAGEHTYGAVGALLGVPLLSAVQAVFLYLRQKARGESAVAGPADS